MLRRLSHLWHAWLSGVPWLARPYFALLALAGPHLQARFRQQIINSLNTSRWPGMKFPPREIEVSAGTRLWLHPHAGEFDFQALLGGRFSYEDEMFAFLDPVIGRYDAVIDIGANVGLLSLYAGRKLGNQGRVYAFEPSTEAFRRLLENLRQNQSENVQAFNCAIGSRSGFAQFTEPEGHLTNGSLIDSFARQFSDQVNRTTVMMIDAAGLSVLLEAHQRVLVKIDTEGFEAEVLQALAPVLRARRPDLIIEVLPEFEAALNAVPVLGELSYKAASIAPQGLVPTGTIRSGKWRNCLLTCPPAPPA